MIAQTHIEIGTVSLPVNSVVHRPRFARFVPGFSSFHFCTSIDHHNRLRFNQVDYFQNFMKIGPRRFELSKQTAAKTKVAEVIIVITSAQRILTRGRIACGNLLRDTRLFLRPASRNAWAACDEISTTGPLKVSLPVGHSDLDPG